MRRNVLAEPRLKRRGVLGARRPRGAGGERPAVIDLGSGTGAIALAVVIVGALAVMAARSVRLVGSAERLVVFRFGRADPSMVRGPGRTFLLPVLDRGVLVTLEPQVIDLTDVPAVSVDGRGISADLVIAWRVVDPLRFAVRTIPPPAVGIRLLARTKLRAVAAGVSVGDVLSAGWLEGEVGPAIEEALILSGATQPSVRVTNVRVATISEAEEAAVLERLGAHQLRPDPDTGGSHTLTGDLVWGLGRLGRMTRWAIFSVPIATIAIQVFHVFPFQPMTRESLFAGVALGLGISPWLDIPDAYGMHQRIGWPRTIVWWLAALLWFAAALGVIALIGIAAGLD
jgi:hypothetical protein